MMSCTNITSHISGNGINVANTTSITTNTSSFSHTLKNFNQAVDSSNAANLQLTITTDTSSANYQSLAGFCSISGTNACACELVWTQNVSANGTSYAYPRTIRNAVTEVQSGSVKCAMLQSVWSEIADATVIAIRIVPAATNTSGLSTSTLHYKKGTSVSATGDFLDDTLTPFRNIHRYTCFSKTANRAYELVNQFSPVVAGSGSSSTNVIMGSRYCGSASAGGAGGTGSSTCISPRTGYSAQSYYRNLFIRSDLFGTINSSNDTYDCPKVLESVRYSAGQSIPTSEINYFPLDSSFSLATTNSSDWSVGVSAASTVFKAGDINSPVNPVGCVGEDVSNRLTDGKVNVSCLGYAKKPAVDGTCGTIKDNNGRVRPLTRLRRFRVVYPPVFDSTGKIEAGHAFADEVYVADRLTVDATGAATGNMVYGPKPCNFAWFDHEGITTRDSTVNFNTSLRGDAGGLYSKPGYIATTDYQYLQYHSDSSNPGYGAFKWSVDPDGLVIPNFDHDGSVSNAANYASCSISLPWIDWTNGTPNDLRLITTHQSRVDKVTFGTRSIYLREVSNQTVDPWSPNYVEDVSFAACVPLPTTFVEPPLHFYKKDDNTMAWCSKVYPTQNPYWYEENKFRKPMNGGAALTANVVNYGMGTAPVKIFTSHETSGASLFDSEFNTNCLSTNQTTICSMTNFVSGVDSAACQAYLASEHVNKSCDRTVVYDSSQTFLGFPLLAKDADITKMLTDDLNHDKVFGCEYSVNKDPTKVGAKIPGSGCCGYVGSPSHKLLTNLINGTWAHLEPYKDASSTTDQRFCGYPVE